MIVPEPTSRACRARRRRDSRAIDQHLERQEDRPEPGELRRYVPQTAVDELRQERRRERDHLGVTRFVTAPRKYA
jgi:hypothetical protein